MTFSSIAFFLFFPLFFVGYWVLGKRLHWQNLFTLAGSLFFYGYWDWRYLLLLLLTIASSYFTALGSENEKYKKVLTGANILLNVGILCVFKYFNFFSENLVRLFHLFGLGLDWFTIDVLLPVGISFYTFQAIGYSVDVYKGKIKAERNFVTFAIFLSFFPQLVAGPIERASALLPQFSRIRKWDYSQAVDGMRQALWGLFKKIVIADTCGMYVEELFSIDQSSIKIFLGVLLFSVQIYCDFSGYCDIALGCARMLGIRLMTNFHYPYFSHNIQEFWQRWNISLMRWFQEYIYFPLGGSRRGHIRTYFNILIVFTLSGLWHGASWNFIIWGLYWGILMVAYRWIKYEYPSLVRHLNIDYIGLPLTCSLAAMGWLVFRCTTENELFPIIGKSLGPWLLFLAIGITVYCVGKAINRLNDKILPIITWGVMGILILAMCFDSRVLSVALHYSIFIFILLLFIIEWRYRNYMHAMARMPNNKAMRYVIYFIGISLLITNHMEDMAFIYFQF